MTIRRASAKEWGRNMVHSLPDEEPSEARCLRAIAEQEKARMILGAEIKKLHRFTRYTLRMLERMTSEQFAHGRDKGIRRRARKLLGIRDD